MNFHVRLPKTTLKPKGRLISFSRRAMRASFMDPTHDGTAVAVVGLAGIHTARRNFIARNGCGKRDQRNASLAVTASGAVVSNS